MTHSTSPTKGELLLKSMIMGVDGYRDMLNKKKQSIYYQAKHGSISTNEDNLGTNMFSR